MRRIGKNDIIFMAVLAVVLGVFLFWNSSSKEHGAQVEVTVDGKTYGTYALAEAQEVPIMIEGRTANVLVIKGGMADVTDADCPDKLCVHQNEISKTNETIVCLPNKVVVQVLGSEESRLDTIAK